MSLADILLNVGPVMTLFVAGILSVNLGVVNILPFPPLDGGRMMVLAIKRLFGTRVSLRAERLTYAVGFVVPDGLHPLDLRPSTSRGSARRHEPGRDERSRGSASRRAAGRRRRRPGRARRRSTVTVDVGGVPVGSSHPVVVQSMTNTDTADADGTAIQVARLAHAGSELVRVTVNNDAAAAAVPEMLRKLRDLGVGVPVIGDFHYNGHQLLVEYPEMARGLAKYRINPGNVGAKRHDENFQTIVRVAIEHDKPVRIGVNWGSLDQALLTDADGRERALAEPRDSRDVMIEAMIESAMRSAELAEETGLGHDRIILSAKVSNVRDLVDVYRLLAARSDYPLHLGLTEAGLGHEGHRRLDGGPARSCWRRGSGTRSASRSRPPPAASARRRCGSRSRSSSRWACARSCRRSAPAPAAAGRRRRSSRRWRSRSRPTCGTRCPSGRPSYPGVEEMTVAVMGCVVNGPGESKHANIGISLPGTFEEPVAPVFVDGQLDRTLRGDGLVDEFIALLEDYVERRERARRSVSRRLGCRYGAWRQFH